MSNTNSVTKQVSIIKKYSNERQLPNPLNYQEDKGLFKTCPEPVEGKRQKTVGMKR